jgi:hypothetical protein
MRVNTLSIIIVMPNQAAMFTTGPLLSSEMMTVILISHLYERSSVTILVSGHPLRKIGVIYLSFSYVIIYWQTMYIQSSVCEPISGVKLVEG